MPLPLALLRACTVPCPPLLTYSPPPHTRPSPVGRPTSTCVNKGNRQETRPRRRLPPFSRPACYPSPDQPQPAVGPQPRGGQRGPLHQRRDGHAVHQGCAGGPGQPLPQGRRDAQGARRRRTGRRCTTSHTPCCALYFRSVVRLLELSLEKEIQRTTSAALRASFGARPATRRAACVSSLSCRSSFPPIALPPSLPQQHWDAYSLEDSEGFTRHNFDAKVSNYSLMVRLALTKNHLCPGADSWRRLALDRPPLPAAGHVLACLSPGRG